MEWLIPALALIMAYIVLFHVVIPWRKRRYWQRKQDEYLARRRERER